MTHSFHGVGLLFCSFVFGGELRFYRLRIVTRMPDFEAVIGLEVHAQLNTATKAFCSCPTAYGAEPNSNTCPVCLGHPGALPVFNHRVVDYSILMGLATHSAIRPMSGFARKNYFYPDLPKGYQISQFEDPICYSGYVDVEMESGDTKRVRITRIHMEEDAGKSIHDIDIDTLVDLNRCGVPLIEIVSEPDLRSPQEAYRYLMNLRQILMYLGICDGNLEEGSMRCDANISVRPRGAEKLGTRTEIKNLNSFRNVEKAIEFEINRQIELIGGGGVVEYETRMWDSATQSTRAMRSKEAAHDYRYFPEPDLVSVTVDSAWIERIKSTLPELPLAKKIRFIEEYQIPAYDASLFVAEASIASFFETTCAHLSSKSAKSYKLVSNWIMTELMRLMGDSKQSIHELGCSPAHLAELVDLIAESTINSKVAKDVFEEVIRSQTSPREIVKSRSLAMTSDEGLIRQTIDAVLAEHPDTVAKFAEGKKNVFGFLVGQVLRLTQGKADPNIINTLLQQKLEALVQEQSSQ